MLFFRYWREGQGLSVTLQNIRFWQNDRKALLLAVENQNFPRKEQAKSRGTSLRAASAGAPSTSLFCEALNS
jgi:hypothetical protein